MEHCVQRDRIGSLEEKANKLCKFQGSTESDIKTIFNILDDIRVNHLRHLNQKINALLFTVLGSVFIAILVAAFRYIMYVTAKG